MEWIDRLNEVRPWVFLGATLVLASFAAGHAVLYRRDSRAAVLWVGVILLVPLVGAALYFILGVNRIRRRAMLLRGGLAHFGATPKPRPATLNLPNSCLPESTAHLASLASTMDKLASRELLAGNSVRLLENGDNAYPAMLAAIASARHSITLSTYIFDRDDAGMAFAEALGQAVQRGVEVRVLIDATGTRYSWPPILGVLRRHHIRFARFLPTFPLWRLLSINLRCHRKILVIDGRLGFTGGMNIRVGHWLARKPRHPIHDLHFEFSGPVVAHFQEVFAEDWLFTTREALRGDKWFPPLEHQGSVMARGIADGPDEDLDRLRWTLLGALSAARHSVRIVTPYFLPDPSVISALNLAALRGVTVEILLPAKSNLPLVSWASRAMWWQMLERGCQIWLSPAPFDHSKLMVVDDCWSLVGSANWDPRSLRLNFEFNVECYDRDLAAQLTTWFERRRQSAHPVTLGEVDSRNLPVRLRDGIARLFTPFL